MSLWSLWTWCPYGHCGRRATLNWKTGVISVEQVPAEAEGARGGEPQGRDVRVPGHFLPTTHGHHSGEVPADATAAPPARHLPSAGEATHRDFSHEQRKVGLTATEFRRGFWVGVSGGGWQ